MSDKTRERETAPQVMTVRDPLRPAVVRRRIVDATIVEGKPAARTFSTATMPIGVDQEDEDNGPPSSVNVARALASLRADELQRVEALLEADDEEERRAAAAPPPIPTVVVGKEISLSELGRRMSISPSELLTTLVSRGFYSMTAKTMLSRDTSRVIAEAFGWQIAAAPDDDAPTESSPANSVVRAKKKTKTTKASAKKRTAR